MCIRDRDACAGSCGFGARGALLSQLLGGFEPLFLEDVDLRLQVVDLGLEAAERTEVGGIGSGHLRAHVLDPPVERLRLALVRLHELAQRADLAAGEAGAFGGCFCPCLLYTSFLSGPWERCATSSQLPAYVFMSIR